MPSDCKFNWCFWYTSSGTNHSERVKHDVKTSVSILSKINSDINTSLIRDCFRLGKYKLNLVKLNRAMDVTLYYYPEITEFYLHTLQVKVYLIFQKPVQNVLRGDLDMNRQNTFLKL